MSDIQGLSLVDSNFSSQLEALRSFLGVDFGNITG